VESLSSKIDAQHDMKYNRPYPAFTASFQTTTLDLPKSLCDKEQRSGHHSIVQQEWHLKMEKNLSKKLHNPCRSLSSLRPRRRSMQISSAAEEN
jgi:hypothetical protein